jgi:hypothetical protein
MAGVFVISIRLPINEAIEELALISHCSDHEEWSGLVVYLPL